MSTPESFDQYLDAWNERDPERRADLLAASVGREVVFADPAARTVGPEALADHIERVQREVPGSTFRRTSGIDGGHDHVYRYSWDMVVEGEVVFAGMDATTVDSQERITRIDGFFGPLPPFEG